MFSVPEEDEVSMVSRSVIGIKSMKMLRKISEGNCLEQAISRKRKRREVLSPEAEDAKSEQ